MYLRKKSAGGWAVVALAMLSAVQSQACMLAFPQAAQTSSVNGKVTDVGGAVIPNVTVQLSPVPKLMPGMTMAAPPPISGRVNADGIWIRISRAQDNHYNVANNRNRRENADPDARGKALRRIEELNAYPHEDEACQGMKQDIDNATNTPYIER